MKYAAMLAEKMREHGADAWLVNTGWSGGGYGVGSRMSLKHTRAIVDAIHSGELAEAEYARMPVFRLEVPTSISRVPGELLRPRTTWQDSAAYDAALAKLAGLFQENMAQYADSDYVSKELVEEIVAAGPMMPAPRGSLEKKGSRNSSAAGAVAPAVRVAAV
jgi:phosphoenolpyruvate carboxykinase (ATP)